MPAMRTRKAATAMFLVLALTLVGCRDRGRQSPDDARPIAERLAGIQPGEEREMSPGTFMKMHRIQAMDPLGDGWQRATSSEGAFSVELPLAFNDFRIRSETTDHVEMRSHSIGAKSPGLLAWSATCIVRRDGKLNDLNQNGRRPPASGRTEARGDKAFLRNVSLDAMSCVLVVEAQGTDPLPSANDRERFFQSLKQTGKPTW